MSKKCTFLQATGQRIGTIFQSLATLLLGIGLSMYYEWSLGLLALAFAPFLLLAAYLQRKVMSKENMGTAKSMESCTKVCSEVYVISLFPKFIINFI